MVCDRRMLNAEMTSSTPAFRSRDKPKQQHKNMGQLNQMIMSPMASSIIRNSFSCSSHMNSCLEHLVVSRGEKKKWVSTKVSHPVLENKITFLIHKHESGPGFNHLKMKRVVVCWQTGGKIHEACFGLQLSVTTYQHM